ncbi:MAG: ZIP family metal transporter [Eubacteriales bacterium]
MNESILFALLGTGFTAMMTALGSGMVFLLGKGCTPFFHRLLLGFAGGVMISASVFSLLNPAMEQAESLGQIPWIPAVGGSSLGIAFLMSMDWILPKWMDKFSSSDKTGEITPKNILLVLAVVLHNIPEGIAVAISCAVAAQSGEPSHIAAAMALALGVGIQNFPEGAAISLPLHQQGMKKGMAFTMGAISGFMEPIFGVMTVLALGAVSEFLPWLLSFAAGAMLYVVVEELIPEANLNRKYHSGTLGVLGGFLLMMILNTSF